MTGIFENQRDKGNRLMKEEPFWKTKALKDMTGDEWESLCDGCGVCCLEKLEDKRTGEIRTTSVSCKYLDTFSCRCNIYGTRAVANADCIKLNPKKLHRITWLPSTCAYRTLAEGRELQWWHPLVSGKTNTVHEAGISLRYRVISGKYVRSEDLELYCWACE